MAQNSLDEEEISDDTGYASQGRVNNSVRSLDVDKSIITSKPTSDTTGTTIEVRIPTKRRGQQEDTTINGRDS
jgi:hypothetical protein